MPRLSLNKGALHRESAQLKTFERFLPSLDLKRRQLIAERAKALRRLAEVDAAIERLEQAVARDLPMLSDTEVDLTELAAVTAVHLTEENVVGVHLPALKSVEVRIRLYALLGRPHWVDAVATRLRTLLELRVQVQVKRRRLDLLEAAVRKITQRVNLFDKVLMPRARKNIRRIRIHLAEAERAAVVRAKLAKGKRARQGFVVRGDL